MKKPTYVVLSLMIFCMIVGASGCPLFKDEPVFTCSLVELRKNQATNYYDAVVEVERIDIENPLKSRFYITTPTKLIDLTDVDYTEDGQTYWSPNIVIHIKTGYSPFRVHYIGSGGVCKTEY